jgi:hypothetical protein
LNRRATSLPEIDNSRAAIRPITHRACAILGRFVGPQTKRSTLFPTIATPTQMFKCWERLSKPKLKRFFL